MSLLEAIHDQFEASGLTSEVPGGLWTSEVSEDVYSIPYIAVEHNGSRFEYTSQLANKIEYASVSFFIFGRGAEEVEDVIDSVINGYEGTNTLTFTSAPSKSLMAMRVLEFSLTSEGIRWRDGSHLFRGVLTFEVQISRS